MYVEELIGAETINTVPDATLDKFRDHGDASATLGQDLEGAIRTLQAVRDADIDLENVGEQLQQEGLKLFVASYQALLQLTT